MEKKELIKQLRQEHARCSTHCSVWNTEDKDCEIYGNQNIPPSRCKHFLEHYLKLFEKPKENN